jgi:hypothetical protein
MSTNVSNLADNIFPVDRTHVLVVDCTAPVSVDLMLAANRPPALSADTNDNQNFWFSQYVTMQADGGDIYFYFSADGADQPDPTATGIGGRQGVKIADGATVDQLLPGNPPLSSIGGSPVPSLPQRRFLCLHGVGGGPVRLRMWPSSTQIL